MNLDVIELEESVWLFLDIDKSRAAFPPLISLSVHACGYLMGCCILHLVALHGVGKGEKKG